MTDERMFELIRLMVGRTIGVVVDESEGADPMTMIDIDSCVVYDNGDYPFVTLIGDSRTPSSWRTPLVTYYGATVGRTVPAHGEGFDFVSSTWGHNPLDCIRKLHRPDDATPNEELTELFKLLLTTYKL